MKFLIFGETGQVAQDLARVLKASGDGAVFLGRDKADLSDPEACAAAVANHPADAIINAAAYTAVDRAEEEEALAKLVNADAPGAIARAAAERSTPLVHISTDYVFEGSGTKSWREIDPIGPLGAYGRTKEQGEVAVREARGSHAILRTAWVFSAHGNNFVKTMLRLGAERDELRIVADQIGGPTPAFDIAQTCVSLARALHGDASKSGTYHYSGAPDVSWADFARAIFDLSGLSVAVEDITTAEFPTPATRPANSRLNCDAIEASFGIARPDWRAGLTDVLGDLGALKT
jgi:dTDP-4-dehydrorhamnose reductase